MKALAQSYMSFSFVRSSQSSAWHEWLHLQYLFCKKAAISKSSINLWLKGFFVYYFYLRFDPFFPCCSQVFSGHECFSAAAALKFRSISVTSLLFGERGNCWRFFANYVFLLLCSFWTRCLAANVCVCPRTQLISWSKAAPFSTPEKSAPFLGSIFMIIV